MKLSPRFRPDINQQTDPITSVFSKIKFKIYMKRFFLVLVGAALPMAMLVPLHLNIRSSLDNDLSKRVSVMFSVDGGVLEMRLVVSHLIYIDLYSA